MRKPELSLIISTYQMVGHLRRVLTSVSRQTALNQIEIIVTDDGSTDGTQAAVSDFSRLLGQPIKYVTHPHAGFHLTRCRNDGARVATSPYLLFLDGDCILPADHVEHYLRRRRANTVHFGYCCRLSQTDSAAIHEPAIIAGDFVRQAPSSAMRKLWKLHVKSLFYQWLGHPTKPALKGGNIGIWRSDFERLNGFDENFRAWGCEDDDLSYRVRAAGLRVASILGHTRTYHLWHPPAATKPNQKWSEGQNVVYLKRRGRLTRCLNGMEKRSAADLRVELLGLTNNRQDAYFQQVFGKSAQPAATEPEVEVMFYPNTTHFTATAECRILVADVGRRDSQHAVPKQVLQQADIVLPVDPHAAKTLLHDRLAISAATISNIARRAA